MFGRNRRVSHAPTGVQGATLPHARGRDDEQWAGVDEPALGHRPRQDGAVVIGCVREELANTRSERIGVHERDPAAEPRRQHIVRVRARPDQHLAVREHQFDSGVGEPGAREQQRRRAARGQYHAGVVVDDAPPAVARQPGVLDDRLVERLTLQRLHGMAPQLGDVHCPPPSPRQDVTWRPQRTRSARGEFRATFRSGSH